MSKITEYQEKQKQFDALKGVTTFGITQIVLENGALNQFMLEGVNAIATTAILNSVKRNPVWWIESIAQEAYADLLKSKAEAEAEIAELSQSIKLTTDEKAVLEQIKE
jgi:hypothetical protein